MARRIRLLIGCLTFAACGHATVPPGPVADAVAQARRDGRTEAVIHTTGEPAFLPRGLQSAIDDYSWVVGTPVSSSPTVIVDTRITSWYLFDVEEISRRPAQPPCGAIALPSGMVPSATQLAVPLVAGRAVIDGVTVSVESVDSQLKFDQSRRYLMVVDLCDNRVAVRPAGRAGVVQLDAGDTIRPFEVVDSAFAGELRAFGRLQDLADRIKGKGK